MATMTLYRCVASDYIPVNTDIAQPKTIASRRIVGDYLAFRAAAECADATPLTRFIVCDATGRVVGGRYCDNLEKCRV